MPLLPEAASQDLIARLCLLRDEVIRGKHALPTLEGAWTFYEPVAMSVVRQTEERLGFALPPLLVRYYTEVANGGIGPGVPGVVGLTGGALSEYCRDLVGWYKYFREDKPEPGEIEWPTGLLGLTSYGCGISSYVWCDYAEGPVVRVDPNEDAASLPERLIRLHGRRPEDDIHGYYEKYGLLSGASWVESTSLYTWLDTFVSRFGI